MRLRLPLLLSTFALPTMAAAETAAAPEFGSSVVQMLGGLILVLGLLFACLYLLKRLAVPRGAAGGLLRVVASSAIGPRERVVVLELGDTWLVLGTAPGCITSLMQLPRQDLPRPTGAPGKDFAGWLKQIVDHRNAR